MRKNLKSSFCLSKYFDKKYNNCLVLLFTKKADVNKRTSLYPRFLFIILLLISSTFFCIKAKLFEVFNGNICQNRVVTWHKSCTIK
jgi:hypothetical protein